MLRRIDKRKSHVNKNADGKAETPVEVVEPVLIGTDKGLSTGHNPWVVPELKATDYYPDTLDHMFQKVETWYRNPKWKRIGLVEGKRGCGKTLFLSMLSLKGSSRKDNELTKKSIKVAAIYFFTTFEKFNMGIGRMLRSVADQMAQTIEEYGEVLARMNLDRFKLRKLDPQQLFMNLIAEPLSHIKSKSRYIIVIDALNECYKNYREQIIRIIRDLWAENTPEWLGLIVSASTGTYAIKRLRRAKEAESITFEEEEVNMDARKFFVEGLTSRSAPDVEKGADLLSQKCCGEFLYCRFAMLLLDEKNQYDIQAIEQLPETSKNVLKLYFETLSEKIEDFKDVIAPLVVCRAPLPLKVWRELCDYGDEPTEFNDNVKSFVKPLIYEHQSTARLIHNSIAYMLNDSKEESIRIELVKAHRKVATWCWDRKDTNAFAITHVVYHLCEAERFNDARNLLLNFEWNLTRLSVEQSFEKASNVERALNDAFNVYLRRRPDDREVQIVQTAIDLGRAAISYDKRQLASQLLGRIGKDQTALTDLLNDARDYSPGVHWWQPVYASLKRADSSLRQVFTQYKSSVNAVALAPAANKLATASSDGYVRIYETLRGKSLYTFEEHREDDGAVLSVCFSFHKNPLLASCATDNTVKIWDVKRGEKQAELKHKKIISAIAFGGYEITEVRDQDLEKDIPVNRLITGSVDKKIAIYNVMTQDIITTIDHDFAITDLKFSPLHAHQCAVAGKNGVITVYDWKTKEVQASLIEHTESCNAIAYHPAQNLLISVSNDTERAGGENCILWDLEAEPGEEKVRSYSFHSTAIKSCGFSADGEHFVTAGEDKAICITQLDPKGEYVNLTERADEHSIAVQKERQMYFNKQNKVLKEQGNTQKQGHLDAKMVFPNSHEKSILSVAFFPKGHKFASCGRDNQLKIWSYDPLDQTKAEGHKKGVIAVAFSPDGSRICTSGKDRRVIVWDGKTGDVEVTTVLTKPTQKIYFSDDSKHIALEQTPNNFVLSLPNDTSTKWKLKESKDKNFQDARFKNKDIVNRNGEAIKYKPYGVTKIGENGVDFTIDSDWVEESADVRRNFALGIPGMQQMLLEDKNTEQVYACMCMEERVHILHLRSPHSKDAQKMKEEFEQAEELRKKIEMEIREERTN